MLSLQGLRDLLMGESCSAGTVRMGVLNIGRLVFS